MMLEIRLLTTACIMCTRANSATIEFVVLEVHTTKSRMTQELDRKAFEIFGKSETGKDIKKLY